jgi:hypothetical protein
MELYNLIQYINTHYTKFKISKDKDKAIPLHAWTGPNGSNKYRIPDFKIIGTRRR